MTNPATPPLPAPSRIPWKTIGGILLWALGVVLHAVLPQSPPALATSLQGVGAGLGTVGAVSATADLVAAAPFMRFSSVTGGGWWQVATMLAGGLYYAATRIVGPFLPASLHTAATVGGAVAVAAGVTGWRLWLHNIVQRSKA
jgi:hypothetical protein